MLLAATAATVALIFYLMGNLAVNSDTAAMISPTASFRQDYDAYKAAFPQDVDNIVAVVEGEVPEAAEAAAVALAERLEAEPSIASVFRPDGGPFFDSAGFLFLSAQRLAELGDRLAGAAPFLADLAAEPSLPRLLASLDQAITEMDAASDTQSLQSMSEKLADLAPASANGGAKGFSWQSIAVSETPAETGEKDPVSATRKVLQIQPKIDFSSLEPGKAALAKVREAAAQLPEVINGQVRVRMTGAVALAEEERVSALEGATLAGVLSFLLVTALMLWGLGAPQLVIGAAVTLTFGLVWTAAFAALAIGYLNLISVTFAVLFIGLSDDFGMHFALRYREARGTARDNLAALHEAGESASPALALCALAAAIGFLSFWPTEYAGLGELGLIAGAGMGVALFANLTVLPAWLAIWPAKALTFADDANAASAESWVSRHAKPVIGATALLGVIAMIPAANAKFDFDPINLKNPAAESVQVVRDLGADGDTSRYAAVVLRPDLAQAVEVAEKLKALPEVDRTITLQSFVPKDQPEKLDLIAGMALFMQPVFFAPPPPPPPAPLPAPLPTPAPAGAPAAAPAAAPPPDPAAARVQALEQFRKSVEAYRSKVGQEAPIGVAMARLLHGLESLRASEGDSGLARFEANVFTYFPQFIKRLGLLLGAGPVSLETLPADLQARWVAPDGQARVMVVPAADLASDLTALTRFVVVAKEVIATVTGTPVVVYEAGQVVTNSVYIAALLSFLGITALLLVALRGLIDTLLVLAPLLLAALLTAATITLLGIPFNFANVIVLPLLLGLGVASGIQLVSRARQEGMAALAQTSTPRAVIFSALTTIGSFGTLGLSDHFGMASLGIVLMVAISFTLLSALVVMPALLALVFRHAASGGKPKGA